MVTKQPEEIMHLVSGVLQLSVMQCTYYADTGVLLVLHSVIQYWLDQLVNCLFFYLLRCYG